MRLKSLIKFIWKVIGIDPIRFLKSSEKVGIDINKEMKERPQSSLDLSRTEIVNGIKPCLTKSYEIELI